MPAGWYDDPFTDHLQRYWTGDSWTKETRARPDLMPSPPPPIPGPPTGAGERYINYLVPSIIALVCCAWPLAIPAIVFSVQANNAHRQGDVIAAQRKSGLARLFIVLSMILGVLVWIYVAYIIATTDVPTDQGTLTPFSA